MIAWMLYCVVASAVVAAAARAAESLARLSGYRIRWIWAGALALAAFLSVSSAVSRLEPHAPLNLVATTRADISTAAPAAATWTQLLRSAASDVERGVNGSLAFVSRSIDRAVSPSATAYTTIMWLVASVALGAIFAIVTYRFHRARRSWPMSRVQDVPVRISPSVGPIVIGVVRPEIVVPRWLLHRGLDEQALAVAHELEHLRARDPVLLGLGWLVVVLAPWSPAAWYMLSRLRLAIELDCDARVLRRGAAPRAYGSLLIEVAQNAAPLTLSALGFADESSQLYQRILALRAPAASFARTRALGAGLVAVAGVLVACRIAPPPAVGSETATRPPATSTISTPPTQVQPETVVVRPTESPATPRRARSFSTATVVQRDTAVSAPLSTPEPPPVLRQRDASGPVTIGVDSAATKGEPPLLLIDGVRSTLDDMHRLDPKTIQNVEILKGNAAIVEYGADARHGVITITTKPPLPPH